MSEENPESTPSEASVPSETPTPPAAPIPPVEPIVADDLETLPVEATATTETTAAATAGTP